MLSDSPLRRRSLRLRRLGERAASLSRLMVSTVAAVPSESEPRSLLVCASVALGDGAAAFVRLMDSTVASAASVTVARSFSCASTT